MDKPNNLEVITTDVYDAILASAPDTRGYIYVMKDALQDKTGKYHVSFGLVQIPDSNHKPIIGDRPEDKSVTEFLGRHYPEFYVVPFRTHEKLDPDMLRRQHMMLAEITKESSGIIDTFLFADSTLGIFSKVHKDNGLYRIARSIPQHISRENFGRHFEEQYRNYVRAIEPLSREISSVQTY